MIEIIENIVDGKSKPIIKMPRGDTLITRVGMMLPGSTDEYEPQTGDSIRFALKTPKMNAKRTEYADAEPLILRDISISDQILRLNPADTKPLGFGDYVYDIELTYADGTVDTFIESAPFVIKPEVH